jgi:tRNA(His) 5'-end guanylyltransferase
MKDDLGTRKENYENRTRYLLPRRTYTIIRLDGKAFHTFTKDMERPYDENFMDITNLTAKFLCKEIQGAKFAYVQSDEISILLTDFEKDTTDAWFDSNIQKMVSVAASIATAKFNQLRLKRAIHDRLYDCEFDGNMERQEIIDFIDTTKLAEFDARVFTIPDPTEVENYFIWRQKDAVRNSISMAAQSLYSHKELNGKSQSDQQEMIHEKGRNWNNMPFGFKRGRLISYIYIFDEEQSREFHNSFLDGSPAGMSNEEYEKKMDEASLRGAWEINAAPDFLKDRSDLSDIIPKIR